MAYWSWAVTKTTWTWPASARAAWMPSIPGMLISRKTISGSWFCTMAIASRPLLASPTIESSGQASFRRSIICSRIRRSSSATTAVGARKACMLALVQSGRWRGWGDFVGHFDRGTGAARGRHADDQLSPAVIQGLQPLADVGQSHAGFGFRHEPDAIVEHVDSQLAIDDLGIDLQPATLGLRFQPVLDGVFHQGLQHHRGEDRRFQAFRNTHHRLQASFHSHRHDFQEGAAKIDLLTQRGSATLAHLRHGRAQVADEALLHLGGARRVGLDKLVDARQGIEEEMRLDLGLQRFHARFQHGALELFGCRAMGGFVGGQFRSALAARHHLDDEGGDDEHKSQDRNLEYASEYQAQERNEQQRLPGHYGHPIEETPPHHDGALADLAQGLSDSHRSRGRTAPAALGGVVGAWAALVGIHLVALGSPACHRARLREGPLSL